MGAVAAGAGAASATAGAGAGAGADKHPVGDARNEVVLDRSVAAVVRG